VIQPHGEREVVGTATDKTSFKISESDLRELAHSLRIVGARKASSRAELAVKILQIVEKL
jgi:hypothetical protein